MQVPVYEAAAGMSRFTWIKLIITLTVGTLLVMLLLLHARYITGPGFWAWNYRTLPSWPLYPLMILASLPLLAGQFVYRNDKPASILIALVSAMLSCFAMKLVSVAVFTHPPSLQMIPVIVQNPQATSYYTDAAALSSQMSVRQWLEEYPQLMKVLSLHSKTKPPGPILYYTAFIKVMGTSERTALVAGLVLGAIATLAIPATWLLLKHLTRDGGAAMAGATFLALCPGFVLFFPMFDPTYILLSAALIGLWSIALEHRHWLASVALGMVLALICVITFNVLVIGAFMAAYSFVILRVTFTKRMTTALTHGLLALATAAVVLLIFQQLSGYDPIATFASAWRNQHTLLELYRDQRPYPQSIPFDLVDFALGSGWMSCALVVWFFVNRHARDMRQSRLAILCVSQLVLVAGTGLLQLETARVWNFMLPLLMVPVGLELRTWPMPARIAVYAMLCMVVAVIGQNVKWIY